VKRLSVDRRRKNGMPVLQRVMLRVTRIPHAGEMPEKRHAGSPSPVNRQFTYY